MKKKCNIILFLWLFATALVSAQGKSEQFPEFIYIDASEAQADMGNLFQKHYKMEATDELRPLRSENDALGFTHEKFQQYYKGIKVESAVSTLHSKGGTATMITGNYHRLSGVEVVPAISKKTAFSAAKAHVSAQRYQWEEPLSEHNDYQKPTGELVIVLDFEGKNPPRLAYKFDIYATEPLYRADVYVDAITGQYIQENLQIHHANVPATGNSLYDGSVSFTAEDTGPFRLRQTSSGGGVQTFNLNNGTSYGAATDFTSATSDFTADGTGVEAHYASEKTYDYFLSNHGRNSYDNAGAVLKSYVHYSNNYVNAFWNGSVMTYGDGNGGSITPLVTLDICGHEVSHAVTQYTAGLIYAGQSGALNESFSDIFGEAVENWGKGSNNWYLGDEIGLLIRDMSDPNVTGCPDTYLGAFWDPAQEVHTNSGVQNKWFYLLSDGENGTNDNGDKYCVTGLGLSTAAAIAYRNLSVYLNPSSNYAAARTGAIQAAIDLYGAGSPEVVSTTNAWHAVGVGGPYVPEISCPGNIVTTNTTNLCSRVVSYVSPTAKANCPTISQTSGLASGATFPVGLTTNIFRVTDAAGTTATCSFTVTVNDTQNPVITCPANQLLNCQTALPAYSGTISDNCPGPYSQTQSPAAGSIIMGVTTITLTATDAHSNTGTCSFTVTPNDIIPPTINCPANIVKDNDPGECGSDVNYTTPTATDNCGIDVVFQLSGLPSGAYNPVGVTTNVWQANDISGNTNTCSFTVTVVDVEAPVAVCPSDRSVTTDPGQCFSSISILGGLQITDNCGPGENFNDAPSPFPVGETVVTWTVKDISGNVGTCSFKVTVRDAEPPSVSCPGNINTQTDLGDCAATVDFSVAASDNCGVASTDLSDPSGSAFPVGWTNIVFSATDVNGNVSNCAFQIVVNTRQEVCNDLDDDCDGLVDEAEDWVRIKKAYGSDSGAQDFYGFSVAIDGDYAVVGAKQVNTSGQIVGAAYLLFRDKDGPNAWGQIAKLEDPGLASGDNYGASVAISGGIAAIGSPQDDEQSTDDGSVSIFYQNTANPAQWDFLKKISVAGAAAGDNLGGSVALDGDRLIAGASQEDELGANAGAAYVFYRNEGGADKWGQVSKLLAATGLPDDNFGVSVGIDGEYAVVGANGVDGFLPNAGAAYIYGRNQFGPDAWGEVATLKTAQTGMDDNFGISVDISGPWALVGADNYDKKGVDAGAAFAFYKNHNGIIDSWGQHNLLLDLAGKAGDHYGSSVGIDGEYAVVGARGDDDFMGDNSGRGFAYLRQNNGWVLVGTLEDGNGSADDALGSAAAISGTTVILGAPYADIIDDNAGTAIIFGGLCNAEQRPTDRDDSNLQAAASVHCYPVPFSDVLNIELAGLASGDAQVVVLNTIGQTVAKLYDGFVDGDMTIQWRPYQAATGIYFLRVITEGKIITQTIMLER